MSDEIPPDQVKAPRQLRSEATQRRILDAVAKLLNENRYAEATVQDIISLANCSVGAYYGRFKDKNAALYVFFDQRCSELERLVEECLEVEAGSTGSLARGIDNFVEVVVQQTLSSAPILRAGAQLTAGNSSASFWARAKTMNERFFKWMEILLRDRSTQHTHPSPQLAALYVVAIIGGLSRDAILVGARLMEEQGDIESFKSELKRAVIGYLGCTEAR